MRLYHLLVLVPLLWIGACQPLEEADEASAVAAGLIPLDSIPAEWGHLVAVIQRVVPEGQLLWNDLWFSDPVSGRITFVPVYRPDLTYKPASVYVVERVPAETETAASESSP